MRTWLLAFGIAVALHAVLLLALALLRGPEIKVDAAIEVMLDVAPTPPNENVPVARALPSASPPPAAPVAPKRPRSAQAATRAEPASDAPPDPKPLAKLAPSTARLVVLVRTAALRKTPLAPAAARALRVLPDAQIALAAGLDPIADFDAILIATANPYDVTQTFLAALLGDSAQAERLQAPGGADPRTLTHPAPNLALLGRPEHVRSVGPAWVAHLEAARAGDSLVEVTLAGLKGALDLGERSMLLPRSGTAKLAWPPMVRARLLYETEEEAAQAEAAWPALTARVEGAPLIRLLGLAGLTERARLRRTGAILDLEGPVEQRHLEAIATVLQLMMDRAQARWRRP